MKLVHYPDDCHPKNKESIIRMCKSLDIEYEATNDRQRLNRADYSILWLPMKWISPDDLPPNIKILYGPHHSVFPEGSLCGSPNPEWSKRCIYTTLSDWNREVFYEMSSQTVIPCLPLWFGVNPAIEDVKSIQKTTDCIIYYKRRNPSHLAVVIQELQKHNLTYKLFKYGEYKNHEYMSSLKEAKFVIWIGTHESQGFAFQECLASNVPILLWDASSMFDEWGWRDLDQYRSRKHLYATTAPQWSSECGERIIYDFELDQAIQNIIRLRDSYRPREYILSKTADNIAMQRILDAFGLSNTRPKRFFVSFGNEQYKKSILRITTEAKSLNFFDVITGHTHTDLQNDQDFWPIHKKFIEANPRGYGYWIWKPYLIWKTLQAANDNDTIIYADAGCTIYPSRCKRLYEYESILQSSPHGIIGFRLRESYCGEKEYNKMDLVHYLGAESFLNTKQYAATVIVLRKCENTMNIIKKWYETAHNYHLIDDSPSLIPNSPVFRDHRHDQSIYSLVSKQHGSYEMDDDCDGYANERVIFASRIRE